MAVTEETQDETPKHVLANT